MIELLLNAWIDLGDAWARWFLPWSWQALIVIAATWGSIRINRGRSAAVRHQQWLIGLTAVALLPLCWWLLRAVPPPVPEGSPLQPLVLVATLPDVVLSPPPPAGPEVPPEGRPRLAGVIFLAWVSGVLICAVRAAWGGLHLRRLRRRSRPALSSKGAPPRIAYSTDVATPVLSGVLSPTILIPGDIADWATPDEQRAILLHESAHFERRDHYTAVFQSVVAAVFFFHPFIRYALRQMSTERELACDDRVLASGVDAAGYADLLLRAASRGVMKAAFQVGLSSSRSVLERRVEMILKSFPREVSPRRRASVVAQSALVVGGLVWLMAPLGASSKPRAWTPAAEPVPVHATPAVEPPALATAAVFVPPPVQPPLQPPMKAEVAAATESPTIEPLIQIQQGSLAGTVSDETGAVIPGVSVTLVRPGTRMEIRTTATGAFAFPGLEPGQYSLAASLPGFMNHERTVIIAAGLQTTRNMTLQLSPYETQVEVYTARPASAPRPPAAPAGAPVRVGGDIAQANLIYNPKPAYPPDVRSAGIEGDIRVAATITREGLIRNPRVDAEGLHPSLVTAAIEAVKQWRYKPAMLNGAPIEIQTTIVVSFRLTD